MLDGGGKLVQDFGGFTPEKTPCTRWWVREPQGWYGLLLTKRNILLPLGIKPGPFSSLWVSMLTR